MQWWSQTIGTSADYGRPKSTWVRVSTSRGPEVLEENSVLVREGTYKAAQPRARAETRGVAAKIPDLNLGLKILCNTNLGPKPSVGLLMNGPFSPINSGKQREVAHEGHVGINKGRSGLKTLAMQFLKAYDAWEQQMLVELDDRSVSSQFIELEGATNVG
ncbi:hypothetical protein MTR67_022497 [Solanum verrucosum]|uniref:Uncharacterized protein n=1 Tax=Solanum verrucosum TaxID=315347 RepID=A0AAF0QRY0_SOLVR|nr:hypothetical protein MTR67_022497 [Solanum verrucosum]